METSDLNRRLTGEITLGKVLESIGRNRHYYVGRKLEKFNIGRGEYKILIELYIQEGCCQDDIVNILGIDKFEASKAVKALIEKGYVYKEKDKLDKRRHKLYLTDLGKSIKEEFVSVLFSTVKIMSEGISKEEQEQVLNTLIKMAENMYRESSRLRKELR